MKPRKYDPRPETLSDAELEALLAHPSPERRRAAATEQRRRRLAKERAAADLYRDVPGYTGKVK